MDNLDLDGATFLITGGTGSFGTSMLNRLIRSPKISEIRIFSRDELKQHEMSKQYNTKKYPWGVDSEMKPMWDPNYDLLEIDVPVEKLNSVVEQFTIAFDNSSSS